MTNTSSNEAHKLSWWAPHVYTAWTPHNTWAQRRGEIPQFVEKLLKISDESDENISWLNLFGEFTWEQPYSSGEEHRKFWIDFTSCFVPNNEVDNFMSWIPTVNHTGHSIPDPTLISCDISDFERDGGQIYCKLKISDECPIDDVCVTTFEYPYGNNESEKLLVPHFDPIDKLKLGWFGHESQWLEPGSKRAVFDPTVSEDGPTALLFREDLMRRYLRENELTLCWIVRVNKVLNIGDSSADQLHIFSVYALETEGPKEKLVYSQAIP